ncbi:MAG: serpin family protein [Tepidisphaeraceae bacterium]|jgi:serpin B
MIAHLPARRRSDRDRIFPIGPAHWVLERLEPRTFLSATPEQLVAQANNEFAFDMYQELKQTDPGNIFFSPYSIATALEMTLQGAKGQTADQIIQALHLPSSDLAQAGISALYQLFQANPSTAGYTLSTANRLWVDDNFPLLQSFLTSEQTEFGAEPQSVNFADPTTAANTINTWVSDQTHGKIKNLINAGMLNQYTALVITNAIYFKGSWQSAFNADLTQAASFNEGSGQSETVQMMEQTNDFGYYSQSGPNGFQALDLPYQGNELDMLVILPTSDDIDSFDSNLTPAMFDQITNNLSSTNVDVDLPKFTLSETYNLVNPLEDLGITTAFGPGADFSGISPDPLNISFVVHKTFINVDETGTEAAAVTGIGMVTIGVAVVQAPPIAFDANHPFIIAIRDRSTNTILFLGRVTDPGDDTSADSMPPASDPGIPNGPPASPVAAVARFTPASSLFAGSTPISAAQGVLQANSASTTGDNLLDAINGATHTATDMILS